ncbi:MAG: UDP-N-acetylmuramoyl-L-alanine--D-glutamate ligase [bacterium]|nr:UDP-N-acetylmuramoyl-L-alanine--D-glutamate ligase [bacterium]
MDLRDKKVTVLGSARTGLDSALFLKKNGAFVFLSEKKPEELWAKTKKKLESEGIITESGGHTDKVLEGTDFVVVSPGIPLNIPILIKAGERNIPVISEIELAYSFCPCPVIAIGGTNGKTTTTTLLGEVFKKNKTPVVVAGNIGTTFISQINNLTPEHLAVLEISSFQLEGIKKFHPEISITLNITPDHLDRYSSMEDYTAAKQRIFLNQEENDYAVLNYDDEIIRSWAKKTKAKVLFFSTKKELPAGTYLEGDNIIFSFKGSKENICSRGDIKLLGEHNISNVLAVITACKIKNVANSIIIKTIKSFRGLAHRIEFVRELGGVKFYNDSKGTTVDSVIKAIESFNEPVILIAGGQDKNLDFTILRDLIQKKVKLIILIGEAKKKIGKALDKTVKIYENDTLEEAVKNAKKMAESGDVVLLSPGCTSFDMFRDYEDRGNKFKKAVRDL